MEVWGGELRTLSEKQKSNWEGRHPVGGNAVKNGTATFGKGTDTTSAGSGAGEPATFENGAVRRDSLMAVAVFVGACVFGLGL